MANTRDRVPPGQSATTKFPVLTYGPTPKIDLATWQFEVDGLVTHPLRFTYDELRALPKVICPSDFHCVTQWSRLGIPWEGIQVKEIIRRAVPTPEARFVVASCDGGYTTNLPLDAMQDDDVLLAYGITGEPFTPEHGWPLRLIVPSRYAWKSAKWLRRLTFLGEDQPGFWEVRGYSNSADPWKEERYWD